MKPYSLDRRCRFCPPHMSPNRPIGIAMHRPFSHHRLALARAIAALGSGTATRPPGPRVTGAPVHPQVCPYPSPTYPSPSTINRNVPALTATHPPINRRQQPDPHSPGPAYPPHNRDLRIRRCHCSCSLHNREGSLSASEGLAPLDPDLFQLDPTFPPK
jgi:hypothetical protein